MTISTCLLAGLFIGGEEPVKLPIRGGAPEQRIDLAGRWILTMPSGAQWNATLEKDGRCGHIHLKCVGVVLQGEYDLVSDRLSMIRPTDEKMTGLVWWVRNKNLLELTEHPASSQFGSDYRGAILVRRIDEDPAETKRGKLRHANGGATIFVSDTTWDVFDTSDKLLGKAQRVGLSESTPPSTVPGTPFFRIGGEGWAADLTAIPEAQWIWAPGLTGQSPSANLATYIFKTRFTLDGPPESGTISIAADDYAAVFVNDKKVGEIGSTSDAVSAHDAQTRLHDFDITRFLVRGDNTIRVRVQNGSTSFSGSPEADYSLNPAGLVIGGKVTLGRN